MTRRAAELLARLHRHEIDRQKLVVSATAGELDRVRAAIAAEDRRLALEHARAFELPGGPQPLAPYAEAVRRRRHALSRQVGILEARLDTEREELRERVRSWKSLDLAAARLRAEAAKEAARRDRAELEETALLRRAAAQNSGASVTSSPSSVGPNLIWQDRRELSRTS